MAKQAEAPPVIQWYEIDDLKTECEQVADLLTLEGRREIDTRLAEIASMVREAASILSDAADARVLWDLSRLR